MKFATDRPYAEPEAAARKILEIANATPTRPAWIWRSHAAG
jgi:hypothetical protein